MERTRYGHRINWSHVFEIHVGKRTYDVGLGTAEVSGGFVMFDAGGFIVTLPLAAVTAVLERKPVAT